MPCLSGRDLEDSGPLIVPQCPSQPAVYSKWKESSPCPYASGPSWRGLCIAQTQMAACLSLLIPLPPRPTPTTSAPRLPLGAPASPALTPATQTQQSPSLTHYQSHG